MVRYWGNENGNRTFDILIDDVRLTTENISGKWNVSEFRNVEYEISNSMVEGKEQIRVKFQAPSSGYAGGVFYIRLLRQKSASDIRGSMIQPRSFRLNQYYPNPFNSTTVISYSVPSLMGRDLVSTPGRDGELPAASKISLKVFNLLGQEVATLFEGLRQPGNYEAALDASGLSTGIYLYRMTATNFVDTKKTMLLK
jgi:hypothetical protein